MVLDIYLQSTWTVLEFALGHDPESTHLHLGLRINEYVKRNIDSESRKPALWSAPYVFQYSAWDAEACSEDGDVCSFERPRDRAGDG